MKNSILAHRIQAVIENQEPFADLRKINLRAFPDQVLALDHLTGLDLSADTVVNKNSIKLSEEYWWEVSFDNNRIAAIPDTIRLLHRLEYLALDQVELEVLSERIGDLENLRELHLRNNLLETLPASLGKLKNLEVLDVSFNKLKKLPPEIGDCTNLQVLNIGSNDLSVLPPEIGKLTNLKELDFSNYDVEAVWQETVERFELKTNHIKRLPPESGNLDGLEVFEYEGNPLVEPALWFLDDDYLPSAWFGKQK
jgi:Leucine-rich repeat (LRR) protein